MKDTRGKCASNFVHIDVRDVEGGTPLMLDGIPPYKWSPTAYRRGRSWSGRLYSNTTRSTRILADLHVLVAIRIPVATAVVDYLENLHVSS